LGKAPFPHKLAAGGVTETNDHMSDAPKLKPVNGLPIEQHKQNAPTMQGAVTMTTESKTARTCRSQN
jgi:hypothetical protein